MIRVREKVMNIERKLRSVSFFSPFFRMYDNNPQLHRFLIVGGLGVPTNLIIVYMCVSLIDLNYLTGVFIAFWIGLTQGFILNKVWTFSDRTSHILHLLYKYFKYAIGSIVGLILNLWIVWALVEIGDIHYMLAAFFGIIVGALSNYTISVKFVFHEEKISSWEATLVCVVAGYVILTTIMESIKFSNIRESYDSMIFLNVIYNTANGDILFSSVKGYNVLGDHFEPILILVVPAYQVFQTPVALFALQSLMAGVGSIVVFRYARLKEFDEVFAFAFAIFFLLTPNVFYKGIDEFHPMTMGIPFILLTIYWIEKGHKYLFLIPMMISLCCKETIVFVFAPMGFYYLIAKRNKAGIWLMIIPSLVFFIYIFLIVPALRTGGTEYVYIYGYLGNSVTEIFFNMFLRVDLVIENLKYFDYLFIFSFLIIFGLLSTWSWKAYTVFFQIYISVISTPSHRSYMTAEAGTLPTVIFILAAIDGARNLTIRGFGRKVISVLIIFSILTSLLFTTVLINDNYIWFKKKYNDQDRELIHMIPDDASLSTTRKIGSYLALRSELYLFPQNYNESDWVLVDYDNIRNSEAIHGHPEHTREYSMQCIENLREDPNYELIGDTGEVILFKRV